MGYLLLVDPDGHVITLRVPRQTREVVVGGLVTDPAPTPVHSLHDRRKISLDVVQGSLPKKGQ